jgi:uncharacterized damage-inducible protein DinB
MTTTNDQLWINAARETAASYRKMIDAIVEQLTDEELFARPAPEVNSVAILLRHLGGNLRSRWTDFPTTDGEKPDRDREREFLDWNGDRQSLLDYFDAGWSALTGAIEQLDEATLDKQIVIRGEAHTIPQALARSFTHMSYHVGQMALIARTVHQGSWKWLTIAPGKSSQHNQQTWGTAASRSVFGGDSTGRRS